MMEREGIAAMEQRTIDSLFALLRSALLGEQLSDRERENLSKEQLSQVIRLAKAHDLEHLLALGLRKNGLTSEKTTEVEKSIFMAAFHCQRLESEQEKICAALESVAIPFIPLKGAVLRSYYPESWMRTSCDIDILVREEDVEKAAEMLVEDHGYTRGGKGSHDISLHAPNNTHLELHYTLIEDEGINKVTQVLSAVWATTVKHGESDCWLEMPDELFYFYHIAHMAKHFEIGGCGIRPFMDLWILDSMDTADRDQRDALLEQGGLLKFAQVARVLSKVWFEDAPMTPLCRQMQDFIIRGGVYGNTENRVAVQQQKKGGKLRYVLSKVFLPYDVIKFHYPVLQKHRWLLPLMQVRRWCKLIFCGHAKRVMRELEYNDNISKDRACQTREFLEKIGL